MDKADYRKIIGDNITYLMEIYGVKRKDVCRDLDIKYTTYTDWVKGHSYPKIETLEVLGNYFRVDIRDFLADIRKDEETSERLKSYGKLYGVNVPTTQEEKDRADECDRLFNPVRYTVDDYNNKPKEYPVELIDGRYYPYGNHGAKHQDMVGKLVYSIISHMKEKSIEGNVYPGPFEVQLPTGHETVLVPDITVVTKKETVDGGRCVGVPDWIIEIVYPDTMKKDTTVKCRECELAEVEEYWLLYPEEKRLEVYKHNGVKRYGKPRKYSFDERVPVSVLGGFHIKINRI